jgi:hypothetical protein
MGPITVFSAAEIVTMDPRRPSATHVATSEEMTYGGLNTIEALVEHLQICDIGIWGTVLAGTPQPAN